ncbi:MAG: Lipopolysaccharide export system ATP-binding protein LptB [Chlamydiae bacterium]|nr:Lipopolysaccharide export system ATP-binding protein LptB [Chlamydiota bacterium]
MAILEIKNLEKQYGSKKVVCGLDISIEKGEIVGLLGPNGAGKTTSFYMTMGLVKHDRGTIHFKEQDISNFPVHKRAQLGMGYLSQEPSVFQDLTVKENILLILENQNLSKDQQEERLGALLQELNLSHLKDQKAATLSGGERRRLEITRSLVNNPDILLLDEPFANIDPITIQELKKLIIQLTKKGITILITDHNAREIFSICNRIYLIQEGRVSFCGTAKELLENQEARATYLGDEFSL